MQAVNIVDVCRFVSHKCHYVTSESKPRLLNLTRILSLEYWSEMYRVGAAGAPRICSRTPICGVLGSHVRKAIAKKLISHVEI